MIKFLSDSVAKKYAGKTCLLRIDLNTDSRNPLNSYKLEAVIPTIKAAFEKQSESDYFEPLRSSQELR